MFRASLEESLAFLAPKLEEETQSKKAISPVRIPDYDPEDIIEIESLLRSEPPPEEPKKKKRGRKKKVPVKQVESESEEEEPVSEEVLSEELKSEEEPVSEEVLSEELKSEEEEEPISEEPISEELKSEEEEPVSEEVLSEEEDPKLEEDDDSSSFGEDDSDPEIEINSSKIRSLTPKRFKVKFPKSPEKIKDVFQIKNKLLSLRYSIIKFIFNEEDSSINYIICFDPNGEIVFIDVTDEMVKVFDEEKILRINYKDESLNMSASFLEGIRNKLGFEVYGVVFFDGIDYCIMKRNNEGTIICDNYTTLEQSVKERSTIPYCYSILKYKSLISDPIQSIKSTKSAYQVIQTQQMDSTRDTIEQMMYSTKGLTDKIYEFDRKYKEVTSDIISDWKNLSNYASKYYSKFNENSLDKEDKEVFDQVTVNMFVRFQVFNEQVEEVDKLHNVIDKIKGSIYTLENVISELDNKNKKLKNQMITIDELDQYI